MSRVSIGLQGTFTHVGREHAIEIFKIYPPPGLVLYEAKEAGILPALAGSLFVISLTAIIAIPLGLGAAIYLEEYARKGRLSRLIEINIANLAGVSSIIYGLLGLGLFVRLMHMERSVLAGAFHDDPVISWMVPDEDRRRTGLAAIMELFAARCQPHGENHLNDTGTGAAVWAPPAATFAPEDEERVASPTRERDSVS